MVSARRLYTIVTATGAVIMALEILSSRILAPHFGNSVYIWGSIISVFLAALALGYAWGGRLADRQPRLSVMGRLILLAALCQLVLLYTGTRLAGFVGDLTGNTPSGTLIAATLLFGPPSVLLGTVSPYAVRLATRDLAHLGNTAGRLFALSTGGSLVGTLGATFVLIPYFELRHTLAALLLLTAVTGGIAVGGGDRQSWLLRTGAALLAGVALSSLLTSARPAGDQLFQQVTPYQTLEITERDGIRYLRGDRVLQSAVRLDDGEPALRYPRYAPAALLVQPQIDNVLVLGMGGGSVGRYLRRRLPELEVDYVDIDPAIPEIARNFLMFRDHELDSIHVGDGRQYLARSEKSWDYIYSDTYIGLSVPFHLTTIEFVDEVRRHLEPGGVFGVNLASGLADPFSRAVFHTLSRRFAQSHAFAVHGTANVVVIATDAEVPMTRPALVERGRALDERWSFDPTLASIAASRLDLTVDAAETLLLTDDFAPANHLIRLGEADLEKALGTEID